MRANRCPGRYRHWRVARGTVGMRTPVCVCCGSPNPNPLTEDEWAQLLDWARYHNVGDYVRTAIEKRETAIVEALTENGGEAGGGS
jgi:hypothetical protein